MGVPEQCWAGGCGRRTPEDEEVSERPRLEASEQELVPAKRA